MATSKLPFVVWKRTVKFAGASSLNHLDLKAGFEQAIKIKQTYRMAGM